ncbi:MAG TPA: hypothetical protein VFY64_01440 [Nitrososphaeraceae archaeon]|jgi:hypothetical protein|nr:hypothetical protein [Nitrososphaeraceae archaeon]
MESSEDRSSNAVRVWMPLGAVAAAITFMIAFIMRIPQEQTIAASALAGILVFSGFLFRSFGKEKGKYRRKV